jgi:hypothetical protein
MIELVDEAKDSGLQLGNRSEDAALGAAARELGKEALHGIEPRRRCRSEVKNPSADVEPFECFGMLVGRIVIDDGMDSLSLGDPGLDGVEEADELLMPMAWHTAADHLAIEDIERGEQGRGAVALARQSDCSTAAGQRRPMAYRGSNMTDWQKQRCERNARLEAGSRCASGKLVTTGEREGASRSDRPPRRPDLPRCDNQKQADLMSTDRESTISISCNRESFSRRVSTCSSEGLRVSSTSRNPARKVPRWRALVAGKIELGAIHTYI